MRDLIFSFFLLTAFTASSFAGGTSSGRLTTPLGGPCDSVSPTPIVGEMLITSVSVAGGGSSATVTANDSFTVSVDFHIQVCEAPASDNFCQVVVGYASAAQPAFCIFRERVDCSGTNRTVVFRMKAPAFPAEYLLAFDLKRTLTEPPCPGAWPSGPPAPDRFFACISVTAGNVPVPLTGGVDNVTLSSATLHATVNPQGAPTAVRFLLGTAPGAYADSVTAVESPVSGSSPLAVSAPVSGLSANTLYYYRATAESENGYNVGEEKSFFTGARFALAETLHQFGHLALNAVKTDSVAVLNDGNLPLQVSSVIPLSGQYSVSPATSTIPAGGTRKFAVSFAPPAYGDYRSGVVFNHSGATTPDTLAVDGDVPIGEVRAGWNIVAVPLTVADPRKTSVFPGAVSNAFGFAGGYVARDTLVNGRGYWLKYAADGSLVVAGDLRENETVAVVAGWNLVGGPSYPVPLDSVASSPPGIVAGSFFGYDAGYSPVTVLEPGKGYWVKVGQAGTLTLKGQVPGGVGGEEGR